MTLSSIIPVAAKPIVKLFKPVSESAKAVLPEMVHLEKYTLNPRNFIGVTSRLDAQGRMIKSYQGKNGGIIECLQKAKDTIQLRFFQNAQKATARIPDHVVTSSPRGFAQVSNDGSQVAVEFFSHGNSGISICDDEVIKIIDSSLYKSTLSPNEAQNEMIRLLNYIG